MSLLILTMQGPFAFFRQLRLAVVVQAIEGLGVLMGVASDELAALAYAHSRLLPALVFVRALPVLGAVVLSSRFSPSCKWLSLGSSLVILGLGHHTGWLPFGLVGAVAAVFAYFTIVTIACCFVMRRCQVSSLGNALLVLVSVFVFGPAIFVGDGIEGVAVAIGWEMMLSSYSLLADAYRRGRPPVVGEHLYFVLVNPLLVFPERGKAIAEVGWHGVPRAVVGVGALYVGRFMNQMLARVAPDVGLGIVVVFLVGLVGIYLQHSGVASLQIGMMRCVGHPLPERYLAPLMARSPVEFWRRWNTYVGAWAARYLYAPTALFFRRRWGIRASRGVAFGVIITFGGVGILHDLGAFASMGAWTWAWTAFFVFQGILVVAWEAVRRVIARRWSTTRAPMRRGWFDAAGWLGTLLMVVLASIAMSAIHHRGSDREQQLGLTARVRLEYGGESLR